MADYLPKHGIYQAWQAHRRDPPGGRTPEFPRDFRHVANVDAPSLERAFHLAHGPERSWMDNPGVEVLKASRPIGIGDVLVDPQLDAHRVEKSGYTRIGRLTGLVAEKANATERSNGSFAWVQDRAFEGEPILTGRDFARLAHSVRVEQASVRLQQGAVQYQDEANRAMDGVKPSDYARSAGKGREKGLER